MTRRLRTVLVATLVCSMALCGCNNKKEEALLKKKADEAEKELKTVKNRLDEAKAAASAAAGAREVLNATLTNSQAEVKALKNDLKAAREKAVTDLGAARTEIVKLQKNLVESGDLKADLAALQEKLTATEQKLKLAEADNVALKLKVAKLTKQLAELKALKPPPPILIE